MTDFTAAATSIAHAGKHNMASDAFDALRAGQGAKTPELSFSDLVDTMNPLQHIPVVSQIYRHLTGDTISSAAQVAGDALYGGAIGLVTSVASAAIGAVSGSSLGDDIYAALFGDDNADPVKTASATATATAAPLATDATGSIVATATPAKPAVAGRTRPVPQLSPEAFNALINSFADPRAAEAANPDLTADVAATNTPADGAKTVATTVKTPAESFAAKSAANPAGALPSNQAMALATGGGAARPSKDLMSAMQKALDQYDAMKATMPALPAASLDMSGGNESF